MERSWLLCHLQVSRGAEGCGDADGERVLDSESVSRLGGQAAKPADFVRRRSDALFSPLARLDGRAPIVGWVAGVLCGGVLFGLVRIPGAVDTVQGRHRPCTVSTAPGI